MTGKTAGEKKRGQKGARWKKKKKKKSCEEWLCITCLRQWRDPLLFIKITFTFQRCLCCKQSAYSAAVECALPKKPPPLVCQHTLRHTHTHACVVSCLCKVICRGEDDCSPSWWPWQRLTACIHRWRWMQWVRSAAGVSCLFQGTLALMTWLIACPGSTEPLINQAADWIQSFASPAHWWTGKDAGPGADTRPAQGPRQLLLNVSATNSRLTASTQRLAVWLLKKGGSERKTVTAGVGRIVFFFLIVLFFLRRVQGWRGPQGWWYKSCSFFPFFPSLCFFFFLFSQC